MVKTWEKFATAKSKKELEFYKTIMKNTFQPIKIKKIKGKKGIYNLYY